MQNSILDIKNLTVIFNTKDGRITAIQDLSMTIRHGEILAVVGESGCGKSVLCKTIMGLLPKPAEVKAGSIRLGGRERNGQEAGGRELVGLADREYRKVRGTDISMVFQDPMTSLDPAYTIGAQISEAIRIHDKEGVGSKGESGNNGKSGNKTTKEEARRKAIELMDAVGIDRAAERYDAFPWMLSGGMRQRCVLAMALAGDPQLLIADEPTTALDVTVQAEILDLLLELRDKRNLSVLFISHDLGVVSRVADTVSIMYAGRVIETGTTKEVLEHPAHPYTWSLLHALPVFARDGRLQPIPGAPPTVPEGFGADAFAERNVHALGIDYVEAPPFFEITPTHRVASWLADPRAPKVDFDAAAESAEAAAAKAGEALESDSGEHAASQSDSEQPILQVQELSHAFRLGRRSSVRAVDDVSFEIHRGEIFALVGESGCGKTTLARCIMGMYQPLHGKVIYEGLDMTGRDLPRAERFRLAREIQFISQDPGAALDPKMTVRKLIAEPLQIHGMFSGRREMDDYIIEMLHEVQLDENIMDRVPAQLSGGQKQRVSIARAFSMNPKLLVADEPLASLDVSIQAQIVELLLELQQRHGTSILFISHDLSMVKLIADHVGVMYHGSLVETGPAEELFRAPKHSYTKTLLEAIPVPGEEARP